MNELTLLAPAKLNLFLHVLGRRPDGYHNLQTLFALIDLTDEVHLRLLRIPQVQLSSDSDGPQENNLVVRAARSLLNEIKADGVGCEISLHKRIPQGGLGGGSSDAASTLLGLNALLGSPLDQGQLMHLGRSLGADVPVFIGGQNALAGGIGDELIPVQLPIRHYLILSVAVEVSTAMVFNHGRLPRDTPSVGLQELTDLGRMRGFLEQGARNDCEALVCELVPQIAAAREWLNGRAPARLTGSGGCLFAAFDSRQAAEQVAAQVPAPWQAWVASGIARSPSLTATASFVSNRK